MGFRFRKSIKILPGIKLNFGKKGISTTIGGKGLSVNVGRRGTYVNAGIPGSGISYRERIFGANKNNQNSNYPTQPQSINRIWVVSAITGTIILIGIIFAVVGYSTLNQETDKVIVQNVETEIPPLLESDNQNVSFYLKKAILGENGDSINVEGTLLCREAPCPDRVWIGFYGYAPYGKGNTSSLLIKVDNPFAKNKFEYKLIHKLISPSIKEAGGGLYLRFAVSTLNEEVAIQLLKPEERGIRNSQPILASEKPKDDSYKWEGKNPFYNSSNNENYNNNGSSSNLESSSDSGRGTISVRGYYRRDGTYVRSYSRRR